ncbi:hypothetical protein BH11CYA1_BH11CYA1_03250 [soil metagenome]
MLSKNKRFISLVLLAVVIGLVSFADSALAGKGEPNNDQKIRNQNALGQLLNPNR